MRTSIRGALALLALVIALPVSATFHLWTMNELYSNADGSVQFLELTALASGQEFVEGHTLRSTPRVCGARHREPGLRRAERVLRAGRRLAQLRRIR